MSELATVSRCYSLRYERRSKHSAARLWRAITDPGELEAWMSFPARVDLRPGGDYFVDFGRSGAGGIDGILVIVEPERHLRYAWGTSIVDWTIEPDGDGCRHVFSQHGLAVRPIPNEEGLAEGWHGWLDDLELHLDGHAIAPLMAQSSPGPLAPLYRARLEAAVGPLGG